MLVSASDAADVFVDVHVSISAFLYQSTPWTDKVEASLIALQ